MPENRNVVLLTIDSLRADYCGFMGDDRALTPNMDQHAADGLVFSNAVTTGPSTLDALPGIFTGQDIPDGDGDIPDRHRHHLRTRGSIPELFAAAGYETAAFTANPWTSRRYGYDTGFDHFEDFFDGPSDPTGDSGHSGEQTGSESGDDQEDSDDDGLPGPVRLVRRWAGESSMFQAWGSFYDDVVAWTEQAEKPYFLWLFLVDVHMPYLPVSGFRSQTRPETYAANLWLYLTGHGTGVFESVFRPRLRRAYEDTIRYTDDLFGDFTVELAGDDPVFVVHSDHGESFGEDGVYGHGPSLSPEQTHVPLFVANGPQGRVEQPFSLRRLPELLLSLGTGEPSIESLTERVVRSRNRDPKFAIHARDWQYVDDDGTGTLYDLTGSGRTPTDAPTVESLAADLIARWKTVERERARLTAATRAVAETHSL
jgi:arylsulfatase A-like enzyme